MTAAPAVFEPPPVCGAQRIPRPATVRSGGPAPWAGLPEHRRRPSLEQVLGAVAAAQPGLVPPRAKERPGSVPSALLVLLYEHGGEPWVVLTRRAAHLRHHAGEVSFPGGRVEPGDADLWATALRESAEEVGVDAADVRPAGRLDSCVTSVSRSLVFPFLATVGGRPELVPDPAEVEKVLHVPLAELTREAAWREEVWTIGAAKGRELAVTFFELPGDTVWGMTAGVLRRLLTLAVVGPGAR